MKQSQSADTLRLLEAVPEALVVVNTDGRIVQMNGRAGEMFGYAHGETLGQPVEVLVPEAFRTAHEAHRTRYAAEPSHRRMGMRLAYQARRKDGREFPVEIMLAPWANDGEGLVLASIRDITERRRAEQEMRARIEAESGVSEQRYRALVENSNDIVCELDMQGRYLYASPNTARTLGYKPSELLGTCTFDKVHPEDLPEVMAKFGLPSAIAAFRFRHKDGSWRWLGAAGRAYETPAGETRAVIFSRDITERRESERRLRQLSSAVEHSPTSVVITDTKGSIEYVNPVFTRITGYTLEEAVGKNPRVLKTDHTSAEEYKRLWDTITAGQVWRGEFLNKKKNGELYWESASISPITDDRGVITNFMAVKEDITERKRAEEGIAVERARFKLIFDTVGIGIALRTTRPDGTMTRSINDAHLRICGLTRAQRDEPEIYRKITHPDDRPVQRQFADQIAAGKIRQYSMEKRYIHPDGKIVWVNFSYQRGIYPDGTIEELTTVVDITAIKQAEEKIAAERARLKFIFDGVGIGIALRTTHPDGTMTRSINDAHERISGVKREQDAEPDAYANATHPDDWLEQMRLLEKFWADGIDHYSLEKRYVHPGGRIVWVDLSSHRRTLPDGTVEELSTLADITALKQAEEKIAADRERLKFIFGGVEVGIALRTTHPDGTTTRTINDAHERISGVPRERDAEPFPYIHVTHPDDNLVQQRFMDRILAGEIDRYSMEKRYIHPGGRIVWADLTFHRRFLPDGTIEDLATLVDITAIKQAEEALRESEEKYRGLFEGTRDAIMTIEPPLWGFASGNPAALKMFGVRNEEEFVSLSPWESSPERQPDGRASAGKAKEMIETAMREGSHYFEWTHRRLSGEEFPATVLMSRMQSAGKVFILSTVRDITKRKRAAEALRASEERFRNIFEHAGLGIAITHPDGRFAQCNPAYCAITGYSMEELSGMEVSSLLHPEDREENMRHIRELIDREIPSFGIENRYVRKTGKPVWVRKFVTILRNDEGYPTHLLALVTDITSRMRKNAVLQRQAELLHLSHDAIFVWSTEGGIKFWNKGAADLYGYQASEIRGRVSRELLKAGFPVPWSQIEAELREHGFWEGEVRHTTKEGKEVVVVSRLQPVPESGDGLLILETNRDITDRIHLEREILNISESERRKFGQELHDDLGQQLTGVMMMTGILADDLRKKSPRQAADLEELVQLLRHAMHSTRRMARGLYPTELGGGDLVLALEGLVNTVATSSGVHCEFRHDPAFRLENPDAAIHLYRIVQEALNNALKHGHPGRIAVECTADAGRMTVTVTNDGGHFKRPPKRSHGMGLSLMEHRAHLLGGEFSIRALKTGGCVVSCSIPAK